LSPLWVRLSMWNDKKSWWVKKAEENKADKTHYKDWCVIKVAKKYGNYNLNTWGIDVIYEYKAVARANAPKIYTAEGRLMQQVEVDNLTKHEAHCVAKGLNFLDGETR
jgi:hypothetical protein